MDLPLLALKLVCRFLSPARLPAFKGSTLRGAFGHALRGAVCTQRQADCAGCLLQTSCPFPQLFLAKKREHGAFSPTLTPPYCIEPPDSGQTVYQAGDTFAFRLLLFARAVDYLPYFIHAFTLMGKRGLGKRDDDGSGSFTLEDVLYDNAPVFDREKQSLRACAPARLDLPALGSGETEGKLRVELLTPLRFKRDNDFSSDISFVTLFHLILRRMKALWLLQDEDARIAGYDRALALAGAVRVTASDTRWHDWERYSSRQKSAMRFGGLTGTVEYAGPVHAFAAFLDFAQLAHVGKQTTFGLGKIRVSPCLP